MSINVLVLGKGNCKGVLMIHAGRLSFTPQDAAICGKYAFDVPADQIISSTPIGSVVTPKMSSLFTSK